MEPEPCQLSYSCNFQNCQQNKVLEQDYQSYTCWWLNMFWNLSSPAGNSSPTSAVQVLAWQFLVHVYAWSGHQQVSRLAGLRFAARVYNVDPLVNSHLYQILFRNHEEDTVYTEEVKAWKVLQKPMKTRALPLLKWTHWLARACSIHKNT